MKIRPIGSQSPGCEKMTVLLHVQNLDTLAIWLWCFGMLWFWLWKETCGVCRPSVRSRAVTSDAIADILSVKSSNISKRDDLSPDGTEWAGLEINSTSSIGMKSNCHTDIDQGVGNKRRSELGSRLKNAQGRNTFGTVASDQVTKRDLLDFCECVVDDSLLRRQRYVGNGLREVNRIRIHRRDGSWICKFGLRIYQWLSSL